ANILERATFWMQAHPQQTTWTALGIVAAALLSVAFYSRSQAENEDAWSKLAVATSYAYMGRGAEALTQIQTLANEHPTNSAAHYGWLLTGDLMFDQKQYPEAEKAYRKVMNLTGGSEMQPLGLAGLTLTQEASGDCKTSVAGSSQFLNTYKDHFLAPQMHGSLVRCHTALGQTEQARSALERMEFLYPNTYWAQWAKDRKG
ncbi:MAG: hypothetical protein COB53_11575, partial [Elusimicrobia bacterium]